MLISCRAVKENRREKLGNPFSSWVTLLRCLHIFLGGHKMNIVLVQVISVLFLVGAILTAGASGQQPEQSGDSTEKRAKELWESAISAKGGRERLNKVQNLLVTYGGKHKTVRLYVFPNKYWDWNDNRPSPLGLSVVLYNLDKGFGYIIMGDSRLPRKEDNYWLNGRDMLLEEQLAYLMETQWVRPVPIKASEGTLNGKPVDVVYARLEVWTIKYMLDKTTHLPMKFDWYGQPEHEGLLPIDLVDYFEVDGIKFPRTVRYGPKTAFFAQSYLVNVDYDKRLFDQPPSIEDGPDAWRAREKQRVPR